MGSYQPAPMSSGLDDLLGLGSDGLLGDVGGTYSPPTLPTQVSLPQTNTSGIFGAPPPAPVPPASAVSSGQVCFHFFVGKINPEITDFFRS